MEKGRLIVFEGACDGIGKSTQLDLLRKKLEIDGETIVSHHFPTYGTYHGGRTLLIPREIRYSENTL